MYATPPLCWAAQGFVALLSAKGHLQDEEVSFTPKMIKAIPLLDLIQDSEGAMPAKPFWYNTSKLQTSEGGPVPIQELMPQQQMDHVHTSVIVTAHATAANANNAPSSVAIEHLCQAKYLCAKHQEGTQVALTPAVSLYTTHIHPVMNKTGQDQHLHATMEGICTQLQGKYTSQVLGNIPVLARIHCHNSYILKGKSIEPPVRLMQAKHKHHNQFITGLCMFKVTGIRIQLPDCQ